jgi:hypothetical protein
MTEKVLIYLIASIVILHLIVGFGWVFWKMRKKK